MNLNENQSMNKKLNCLELVEKSNIVLVLKYLVLILNLNKYKQKPITNTIFLGNILARD